MIELARRDGRFLRIGHRGAAALAPENSLEAIAVAVELGCDLVEFDVRGLDDGRLVLVHDRPRKPAPLLPTLEEALAFLAGTDAGIHLDLKTRGVEDRVEEALRRHGLLERTLVSTFDVRTLRAFGEIEPGVRLGLTYPRDRTGLGQRRVAARLVAPALAAIRATLPGRIARLLAGGRATAAVLHWQVVSREIVERCRSLGVAVLVWTVDDRDRVRRLDEMGVDGVITNDPRVFGG